MSSFGEVKETMKFFNYVYSNLGYAQFAAFFAEDPGQQWVDEKWRVYSENGNNVHKLMGILNEDLVWTLYNWYKATTETEK